MTHRVLSKHKAKSIIQIYSDVMKTIQCAHPPHHLNGFVATCRLLTASSRVHALLVLEPTECSTSTDVTIYLYYALCFMLFEHSVCHEPISVLINVYMLLG